MNTIASISKAICAIGSIALLLSVFFHFENDVKDWKIYKTIIMSIVGIAFASFLIAAYKMGNTKKVKEVVVVTIILLIVVLLTLLIT